MLGTLFRWFWKKNLPKKYRYVCERNFVVTGPFPLRFYRNLNECSLLWFWRFLMWIFRILVFFNTLLSKSNEFWDFPEPHAIGINQSIRGSKKTIIQNIHIRNHTIENPFIVLGMPVKSGQQRPTTDEVTFDWSFERVGTFLEGFLTRKSSQHSKISELLDSMIVLD